MVTRALAGHWNSVISNIVIVFINMAKCNLGKVNLESMCPEVFPTNLHVGWLQGFALP